MKQLYHAPAVELLYLSRDVITTSATEPYVGDLEWDFSKYGDQA